MAVIHLGHNFQYLGSVYKEISINTSLSGVCLTSDMSQYACLEPVRRLPSGRRAKLPDYLVDSLQALYIYNKDTNNWLVNYDFTQNNNIVEYQQLYNSIVLGFTSNTLKDSMYKNGDYIYKLYMEQNDSKIYKNVKISISTQKASEYISLMLSKTLDGPWTSELRSYSILSEFYLKVSVINMDHINNDMIVPTEMINISCLVCQ